MELMSFIKSNEDVLLLNELYVPSMNMGGDTFTDDVLYLTYRDIKTKEKKVRTVVKPKVETFITKPEYRTSFKTQRLYLPKDQADSHIVRYNQLASFIRNQIQDDGRDLEYLQIAQIAKKEVFKWRHSYFADEHISDYAIISYILNRDIDSVKLNISKSFLDIESDIYGMPTFEADEGKAPINAISIVIPYDEFGEEYKHPKVFTFLLRNHIRYKDQKYFENNLDKFISECHEEFDDKYNKPEFNIRVFDDEKDLLKTTFGLLHKVKPDFIMIWNMCYDIPAIIKRLQYLGEDPRSYFCHSDFETPYIRYNYDNIYKNDLKRKSESFDCSSYSCWTDQMLLYAGIRKAKSDYGGNSLDNVANIELNAEKRKYDKKTVNVINGAIEEYWNFVKYSINDVLLQYGIDQRTGDLQNIFEQSRYGGTRFTKTLKQSVYLKNVFTLEYFRKFDIIPKNNDNISYINNYNEENATDKDEIELLSGEEFDHDDIQLAGAVVGDPILNLNCGVKILGKKSNTYFKYVCDLDYSSMYPNIKISSNIGPHTQYGRLIIDKQVIVDENPDENPKFIRGGKFIEDLETCDGFKVGEWLSLPNAYKLINDYGFWRDIKI